MTASVTHPGRMPCPVCSSVTQKLLARVTRVPLIGCEFTRSFAEAIAVPQGDIELVICMICGHVYNRVFEPRRLHYTGEYENALGFSARHRSHTEAVVARLVRNYDLHDKSVVEIGSGAGEFLRRICEAGGNHGIGYDPSQPSSSPTPVGNGTVEVIGTAFDDADLDEVDAVLCQHVLEHLPSPLTTLRHTYEHLKPGGLAFIEVPNGAAIFDDMNIWDLTYEHFSYFSRASLHRVLVEAGFNQIEIRTTFGGQYLDAEAVVRANGAAPSLAEVRLPAQVAQLPSHLARITKLWKQRVARWHHLSRRVVVWGAGTKAVSFVTMLKIRPGRGIDYVVDINPRKAGRFMPGTGQQIVKPVFLKRYQPDIIIVMNPEYLDEIKGQLRELDVTGEVVAAATSEADGALFD